MTETDLETLLRNSNNISFAYRAIETNKAKEIRKSAGVSLTQLGKQIGSSASNVKAWEDHEYFPTISKAILFGAALSQLEQGASNA